MDTLLYDHSIPVISSLQDKFYNHADLMRLVSVVFDPKYAFLIYSPIAYLLDEQIGKRLILTTVIAEWLNQVLKWMLHGERPYWYVHSSGHFDPKQVPIRQFPITCELGPGHPSGHSMVTAAVWFIIIDSIIKLYTKLSESQKQETKKGEQPIEDMSATTTTSRSLVLFEQSTCNMRQFKYSAWTLYLLLLTTVAVSRVFLGCHFPHQCIAGAILGILVAKLVSSMNDQSGLLFVSFAPVLFVTAFATFGLLQALGFDPSWTIKLATKHCVKREYIHLDTAPFFSIMRYCGFALGTGLGLVLPVKRYTDKLIMLIIGQSRPLTSSPISPISSPSLSDNLQSPTLAPIVKVSLEESKGGSILSSRFVSWFSIKILTALLMARLVDNLALFISHSNLYLFYSGALVSYTLFSFAFVNL